MPTRLLAGRTMVTAHVPKAEAEQLRRLARSNERSVSAELRRAIRVHLRKSPVPAEEPGSQTRAGGRDDDSR